MPCCILHTFHGYSEDSSRDGTPIPPQKVTPPPPPPAKRSTKNAVKVPEKKAWEKTTPKVSDINLQESETQKSPEPPEPAEKEEQPAVKTEPGWFLGQNITFFA